MAAKPIPMLCLYRPRKGKEAAFLSLLRAHWTALRGAGLASGRRPTLSRATDRAGRTVFVETFEWRDGRAAGKAHRAPEIMAIWEPMERLGEWMDFLELAPVRPARRAPRRASAGAAG